MTNFSEHKKLAMWGLRFTRVVSIQQLPYGESEVIMFSTVRPDDKTLYIDFYRGIVENFCETHNCEQSGTFDVELNHMNESSVIVFKVRGYSDKGSVQDN